MKFAESADKDTITISFEDGDDYDIVMMVKAGIELLRRLAIIRR